MMDNFYYRLNQTHKNLDNDDYIKKTTEIMDEVYKDQKTKETLLVVGAGNLSDIDLDYLLSIFKSVWLSDIDGSSIKQALGDKLEQPGIVVKEIDYIGIEETNFYGDFDKLLEFKEYGEVAKFFDNKMTQMRAYQFSNQLDGTFDSIYITPIYTQLFYREVEVKLTALVEKGLSPAYKNKILPVLFQSMVEIIDRFNEGIVELVEKNGTVFVGSDVFSLGKDAFSKKVKEAISDFKRMEAVHTDYQNEYGFGLGDYGLYSLSEKLTKLDEQWLLWGKDEDTAYAVKFSALKKQ